jgi:hypothetical protein
MMTLTGIAASYLFVLLQDLTKKPATNLIGTCSSFDLGRPYMPWCPSHGGVPCFGWEREACLSLWDSRRPP